MKRSIQISLTLMLAITFSMISSSGVSKAAAQDTTREVQAVYTTPDGYLLGSPVPGAHAELVRNQNGLTTNVNTSLSSGAGVYSLWWIVFNNPASCATYLCTFDEPDIAVNATARIVANGHANFAAHLGEGGPYSGEVVFGDPAVGLTNPEGALILLIVRYHGPKTPGEIPSQFTRYLGGCPDGGSPCVDEQLVVFPGECTGACAIPF
jgi:hypothetical protein